MNVESAEVLVQQLTSKLERELPSQDIQNIRDYVDAGEWGVAYELLCAQLEEFEVQVDVEIFGDLRQLGEFGQFDPAVWSALSPNTASA